MTNNEIKEIKSLSQSKFRQKYNKFVAEGHKSCIELLAQANIKIDTVYHLESWTPHLNDAPQKVRSIQVDRKTMSRISNLNTPSEVLIVAKISRNQFTLDTPIQGYALYLDRIQDPGNVGTILRIADWYGVRTVIRNSGTADWFHPKVVQASMGSLSAVHRYEDPDDTIKSTDTPTYGAFLEGDPIESITWNPHGILVVGNEGQGIDPSLEPYIQEKIFIPGSTSKTAESLNVGVATGILCHTVFSSLQKRD